MNGHTYSPAQRTLMLMMLLWLMSAVTVAQTADSTRLEVVIPDAAVALIGGTLVQPDSAGTSFVVLEDAVVVFEGDSILAVGPASSVIVPGNAQIYEVSGRWILPGLVDSFAALNNQAYADAYLSAGVTSIVGVGGGRRGPLVLVDGPSPRVYPLGSVGDRPMPSIRAVEDAVDALARDSVDVALLMYGLTPRQLEAAHVRAKAHGMATLGELGFSSYAYGIDIGLDAFIHTTRYSLDAAPHFLAIAVAFEPFSDDLESAKWRYYRWLTETPLSEPAMVQHVGRIGAGKTALMPTMSLLYLDMPEHSNPWMWPGVAGIRASDINAPADPTTGMHAYDSVRADAYQQLAAKVIELEKEYRAAGAQYIAGSGTDVWGTMPGISLHTELEFLTSIGLTPVEALAAATLNPSRMLGLSRIGAIAPGHYADIIVVDSDPTESVHNLLDLSLVISRGQLMRLGEGRPRVQGMP
jgi:hypothetical protein